ncbi:DALR anticodon-binding domain-containing protein [Actinobacillus pleuropneumoniae]|uniref:DALR anticodon-binding domain-containing protein n=1 Tax=Actinobacillus pleuropneumoniae TaxID=715 RepID=UPI0024C1387B|nr:DALR anticodon-binding domain-containing protein [Actinobacillus pleuropneumoniae]
MPNILCQYLYELAGAFSSFYEACPMLNAEENVKKQPFKFSRINGENAKTRSRSLRY